MKGMKKKIAALLFGNMLVWSTHALAGGDTLVVSMGLKEEYNDNIFFDANNEIDDYITTVSPGIELRRKYERTSASLRGRFDIVEYSDNSDLDNVDQLYNAGISHKLTERLSLSGKASYKRDSRTDRDIEETGLTYGTDVRKRQQYSAGFDYVLSETNSASLGYAHNRDDFDDPTETDYDSHSVTLRYNHNLSYWFPLTTGRIIAGYSRYNYPASKIDNYSLTFGAERRISEIYSFYADLGGRYTSPDVDDKSLDADDSFGGLLKFGFRYKGELTSGNAFFSHDIAAVSGGRGRLRERTSFVGSLSRRFTEKITGRLTGGYYLNKSDGQELSVNDEDEHTIRISPRLSYQVTQKIKFEPSYTYTRIKDKEADDDDTKDRNLIFVRLVMEYPFFK